MGRNVTKKRKLTKAERRRQAQRKRFLRRLALGISAAAICVGCLVMIPVLNRPIEHQTSWYVEDGALEIAAPPAGNTDFSTAVGSYDATETVAVLQPDGDDFRAALPDLPSHADAAATEAPDPDDGWEDAGDFQASSPEGVESTAAGPVSITITAAGDCTFGGCLKHDTFKVFKKYVDDYGYDYFFQNVRPVFQADDLTIINLEGPLTDVGTMTTKSGICFRGEPEWTAIMTGSSVELCNFANNHAMDMGEEGFQRTQQALDEAGIGCCAYERVYHTTIKGVRVTALGFDKWNNEEAEVISAIQRERPDCDLLIVNFHWGREMHYEPMSDQKKMAHAIVDAGADLVIGTHPHVFGGVEQYKGKYIAYSLGNFCFGGNTMPSDQRCMMFQQTFIVDDGSVTDGGINVIPCLVSGNPKKNDFQPYILGADAGTKLLKGISKYSNLDDDTLWMINSYPEQIGMIQTAQIRTSQTDAATGTSENEAQVTTARKPDDFEAAEDVFTEADGFDVDTYAGQEIASADTLTLGRQLTEAETNAVQEQIYYDQMSK